MVKKKMYLFIASFMLLLTAASGANERRSRGLAPQRIVQLTQQAKSIINNAQTVVALQKVNDIIKQLEFRSQVANELKMLKSASKAKSIGKGYFI